MKTITFFLCEHMLATSISLPLEQLRAAESMHKAQKLHTKHTSLPIEGLEFKLASIDGKSVKTHTGMSIMPDCAILDIADSSITYLPALWRNPKATIKRHPQLLPWLKQQNQNGNLIAGVGTGCCFMAEAGLLDFKPATTHWYYLDAFAKTYPKVELRRDYFITQADNLYCAASVDALADLTIHFIQTMFDSRIARLVERHFFHEVRQGYNHALHANQEISLAHPDEEVAQAQAWIQKEALQDIQIKDIAARLNMSLRTFNRRFKHATNTTPLQYKQNIRMRNAGELLQTSNLSIAEISDKTGYQDVSHFTSLFKRHFGTTPSQYRTTVRAKLFSVE